MSDSESTPPPPPGGPSPAVSNPFQGIDADAVKNAGLPTKLMLGGGVAFFIFGFFSWWSGEVSVKSSLINTSSSESGNAFDIWQGTTAWLLMIAVAVLAALMLARGAQKNLATAALVCSGLAVLQTLWYWGRIPSEDELGAGAGALAAGLGIKVEIGSSFGLWVCLLAAIVATVGAFMNYQATTAASTN